ncbi:hypothetical protein SDC9_149391 [bioreactor metagenome]|uniref:Uncharacterized protein n=1 Tax=bioreactor metagenome TaxID=1076179 RepID=A0A645EK82_9ZZZZ
MAAGVHFSFVLRSERQAGCFNAGQRVNVGAQHDGFARLAALDVSDKAIIIWEGGHRNFHFSQTFA